MSPASGTARVVRVLTGPTAVGKTEHALLWAERNGAEIISCDSLLFYRGMDIGTAKPSRSDLERVRHHLVDIRDISVPMNVAAYAALARAAAEDILERGRKVLVVGGSGFYLRSFFSAVADTREVPAGVRAEVAALLSAQGLAGLVRELHRLNPAGLGTLDTANPRRVSAALERCLASGRTLGELAAEFESAPRPFEGWDVRLCRLDLPDEVLLGRIGARVSAMLAAGLVAEVRALLAAGLGANPSAARAIGYRETIDVLEGRAPAAELEARIAKDTRALVKKQRTWFRTQLPAHTVLDAADPALAQRLFLA